MKSEILEWISSALKVAGSPAQPLKANEAFAVIAKAKDVFVQGNPRVWWLSLKGEAKSYDSQKYKLHEIVPSRDQSYWLVPETDSEDLVVFDLKLSDIESVLKECPLFEYYVINKDYRWLVAESDHNQFHVVAATHEGDSHIPTKGE